MGIIVDLIIILLFFACIYGGYKRGLANCLLKVLTSVLAIIIALVLYKPFVNFIIKNTTIDDNIALSIEKIVNQNSNEENGENGNEKVINDDSGIPKPIANYINSNVKNAVNEKKSEAISEVSKNASVLIVNIAGIIIIYIIAKIILKILTVFTDIVSKLPIIKQCNQLGGIIYGILEAFIILLIIFTIISCLVPLIGDYTISNIILQSSIGRILYNNNIFLNLIF